MAIIPSRGTFLAGGSPKKSENQILVSDDSRHSVLHKRVQFRISDVYLPEPQEVLWGMYSDHLLQGRVVNQSNNTEEEQFVAVEVEGFQERLFVPIKKVEVAPE